MENYNPETDPFVKINDRLLDTELWFTPEYFPDDLTDQDIEEILSNIDFDTVQDSLSFKIFIDYYVVYYKCCV